MFNLGYITDLVNYYNKLVSEHDIPQGELGVQLDDGYVGTVYSIDFDYINGSFILANDTGELLFAVSYSWGADEKHGKVSDYTTKEISDMIKKTIKYQN